MGQLIDKDMSLVLAPLILVMNFHGEPRDKMCLSAMKLARKIH